MINMDTIIQDPSPLLREKSQKVSLPLSREDAQLMEELFNYVILSTDQEKAQALNLQPAVGIAAVQAGYLKRMCAVVVEEFDPKTEASVVHKYALINPIIVSKSEKKIALKDGEGCLSIRQPHEGYVFRSKRIKVRAYDYLTKQNVTIAASGYLAIVLQHEIDHLNGILFYDHINKENPWVQIPNSEII